jgi:hypothetical protein
LNHISPLLGGEPATTTENGNGATANGTANGTSNGNNNTQGQQSMPGIKVYAGNGQNTTKLDSYIFSYITMKLIKSVKKLQNIFL